jgi:hypothetical protein
MEQVPAWLEATINAAGIAAVYNADDFIDKQALRDDDVPPLTELPH